MGIFVKSTSHPTVEDLKKASDIAFKAREEYEKQLVDAYKSKKLKSKRLIAEAKLLAGGVKND